MADLWLPEGASIRATEREAARLERLLEGDPGVASYVTYVGNGSPRFFLSLDQQLFRANFAQVIVLTKDIEARERVIAKLRKALADEFPAVRGRVNRVPLGPPVNYPVQFRVTGSDIATLRRAGNEIAAVMRASPHLENVHLDWNEQTKAIRLEIDQNKARVIGVSSQGLSTVLNSILAGYSITQYREKDELIEVLARAEVMEVALARQISEEFRTPGIGGELPDTMLGPVSAWMDELSIYPDELFSIMAQRAAICATAESYT